MKAERAPRLQPPQVPEALPVCLGICDLGILILPPLHLLTIKVRKSQLREQ